MYMCVYVYNYVHISRLMDEVQALETENTEKQTQLDRAIREKRAVESELEKVRTNDTSVSGTIRIVQHIECYIFVVTV